RVDAERRAGPARAVHDHDRQRHVEGRAFGEAIARGLDGAPMQLDEMTGDGQPESQAAVFAGRSRIRLTEALEDVREELRCDARTRVAHDDVHTRVGA